MAEGGGRVLRAASSLSNFELNLRAGIKCACVGKKRIRIRTKVCYDFSNRHSSAPYTTSPARTQSLSPSLSLAAVAHFLFRTRRNRRKTFCSARAKRQLENIRKTFATCVGNKQQQRQRAA